MKRVFAHIGFSFALTMLLANLIKAEYVLYVMAGLAILLVASLLIKKYRQALAVPICLGAAVFACLIFTVTYNNTVVPEQSLNFKTADCEFYVTDLPQQNTNGKYSYTVKTKSIELDGAPQNIKLKLTSDEKLKANPYQVMKGELRFYQIGSSAFSSYGYWSKNIFLSSKLKSYNLTGETVKSPMRFIVKARQGIKSRLSRIPGDEGALSRALIIGDKSDISASLRNDFKFSGASHLMAVSGLHLTAICGFLLFILKKLKIKDKAAFGITIAVIFYYAALCGFSKSIVRAGIMMSVLMLGKIFNRHADALNSLGLAAFIICINPFAVCDIGAVLSILCVLSLCTAYHPIYLRIIELKIFKNLKLNGFAIRILSTLAAGFCIMAYSLCAAFIFFGYTSVIGLFASLILIPIGSFATILALITSFAIRIKIGLPFILLSRIVNKLIIALVGFFASFRFSTVSFENYFGFVLAGVLIIFAFFFIISKKYLKKAAIFSTVVIAISLCAMAAANSYGSYAYITEGGAAAIISNGKTVVFGVETKDDYYSVKRFLTTRRQGIDSIFVTEDNYNAQRLAEDFSCKDIHYHTFDEKYSDSFSVSYKTEKDKYNFTADINGVCISNNNTADLSGDIIIYEALCKDKNGGIDLNNGGIIYRIYDKNYKARRVSIWQE